MFPFKIMDSHKIEKNIDISVFGYKTMEKYPIYVSKYTFERHGHLLLIGRRGKRHYVLVKDCSTFMYVHILHHERKKFFLSLLFTSFWQFRNIEMLHQ